MLKTVSGRGYRMLGTWTLRQSRQPKAPPTPERTAAAPNGYQTNIPVAASALVGRERAVQHL